MTKLGEFFLQKSVNKSEVARKTKISKSRLSELTIKETARLTAFELYVIAIAIDVDPCVLLEFIYADLKHKQ